MAGSFWNKEFGTYALYSYTRTHEYIVLSYPGGVLVFNCKTPDETKSVYQALHHAWEVSAAA